MPTFLTGEKRHEYACQEAEELLQGPLCRCHWTADTRDNIAKFLMRISDDEKLDQRGAKRRKRMRRRDL